MVGMRFAKGHGTENDFVILPDPDGELDLTEEAVRLLCDRRAGIGGDGILRVVRTRVLGEALAPSARTAERAEWFMDYRNSDGTVAEMCGNGVRVFARYLLHAGLVEGDVFEVGTRDGAKEARVEADGDITVDMGRVERQGTSSAKLARQVVRDAASVGLGQLGGADVHAAVELHGVGVDHLAPTPRAFLQPQGHLDGEIRLAHSGRADDRDHLDHSSSVVRSRAAPVRSGAGSGGSGTGRRRA